MGYDTSILNFVTLDLKFCFANSFDSCRMGGLALLIHNTSFLQTNSGIFVKNCFVKFIKDILYSQEFSSIPQQTVFLTARSYLMVLGVT